MHPNSPLHSPKYDFSITGYPQSPSTSLVNTGSHNDYTCKLSYVSNTSLDLNIENRDNINHDKKINTCEFTNLSFQVEENILNSLLITESSQPLPNLSELIPNLDDLIPIQASQEEKHPNNPGKMISRSTLYHRQKVEDPNNPGKMIPRSTLYYRQKVEDPNNPGKMIPRSILYYRQKVEDPNNPGKMISRSALYYRKKRVEYFTTPNLSSVTPAQKRTILHNSKRD